MPYDHKSTAESAEYERGYVKGYEDGLLAPQSEWMKARRKELAQAFNEGIQATIKADPRDVIDNPYEPVPPPDLCPSCKETLPCLTCGAGL